ncbi:MAG: hypothetical protein J6V25_09430 [Oscillospiraceae bacterium]|nr:hypothetical protein [Oscillospiraceae bacterium]
MMLFAASCLLGCSAVSPVGSWSGVVSASTSEATELLQAIDAYDSELAAADLTSLQYVKTVTFTSEKTYRFGYDIAATKSYIRSFFDQYFNDLYQARSTLNADYGMAFDDMSKDEFFLFYADLYSCTSYEELLDTLTENAYYWDEMEIEGIETGTYTISGKKIMCTITGETIAESLGFSISGDQLTLEYVNGTEVYTRVN